MLPLLKSERKPSKCYVAVGSLPAFVDPKQPPQKPKPFNVLLALKWCHTLDVLLPAELRDVIKQTENRQIELGRLKEQNVKYAKVIMKLGDVLNGEFFTEYVKKGDILMLSEGRPGVDTTYELRKGILRIEVNTPIYERLGLVGQPIRDGGLKHKKNRYALEFNLRLPSMLHGKKGFERLVWACKNVLDHSVTWLFYDCSASVDEQTPAPINTYHPLWHTFQLGTSDLRNIVLPSLDHYTILKSTSSPSNPGLDNETYLAELEEYLSLLCLNSPRVHATDSVDPFLSRYTPPSLELDSQDAHGPEDVLVLRLQGFIPAAHVVRMFVLLSKGLATTGDKTSWGAIQAHGFRGEAVTVLRLAGEAGYDTVETEDADMQDQSVQEDPEDGAGPNEDIGVDEDSASKVEPDVGDKTANEAQAKRARDGGWFVSWTRCNTR